MSPAPLGAVVRIFYDGRQVAAGDAIVTTTGRTYVVTSVRVQRRGRHMGRQHLACLVAAEVPAGARQHQLHWYRRARRGVHPDPRL